MSRARTRLVGVALAVLVVVPACGSSDSGGGDAAPAATVALPTTPAITDAPSTIASSTTLRPSTTSVTPTTEIAPTTEVPTTTVAPAATIAPTTIPATLPVPIAAPQDNRGKEPLIEVGTIEIPKIKLYSPMFEGIRLTTLDLGPGHWPGTAMPGDFGNVVVAGHRTSHGKQFRYLDQLVAGDEVVFTTATGRHVYAVTSTEIVKPDAIWIVDQTPDKSATLFACHPVGSTRERIVVHLALASA